MCWEGVVFAKAGQPLYCPHGKEAVRQVLICCVTVFQSLALMMKNLPVKYEGGDLLDTLKLRKWNEDESSIVLCSGRHSG